jgi:hypothetical protein
MIDVLALTRENRLAVIELKADEDIHLPLQGLFAHHREAQNLTDEIHHLLGSREPAQVAVNDHAVEAVVDKGQQISE